MTRIVTPIVEGDGEVQALPVLLRRICQWRTPAAEVTIGRPIRVRRDRFLNRPDEFERMSNLAGAKAGDGGSALVLLDADDDCPATLGPKLAAELQRVLPRARSAVVLANREYEAWFIAAARSLHGVRGFNWSAQEVPPDPDVPRNAKGWVREHTKTGTYSPITDQAAFSQRMDLEAAYATSRSFRKLTKACEALVGS